MSTRAAIVVVGASAGGVEVLLPLLAGVTAAAPPLLAVLHLPRDRPSLMAEIFARSCQVPVREAVDKSPLEPGTITFAPPDYHLLVERGGTISLSVDEPVQFCRPAIDVLFESAADVHGAGVLAIVLTGANDDGAAGAAAVHRAGGRVLVQDPATARNETMPRAVLAAVPAARVCGPGELGAMLRAVRHEAKP